MELLVIALLVLAIPIHAGVPEQLKAPSPSPSPSSSISLAEECTGVVLEYQVASVSKIFPFVTGSSSSSSSSGGGGLQQPFRFQSTLSITNTGFRDVKGWQATVGFQHGEWLTQAEGVVLADGQQLPIQVGNAGDVTLVGYPQTDIKNSIETAGDYSKIQLSVNLLGTEFGVGPPHFPLPKNLSLVNDGYQCGSPRLIQENRMRVCCSEKQLAEDHAAAAAAASSPGSSKYLPRELGDLKISYDVLQSFNEFYWAQVSIANGNPLGRLDNWRLSWQWKQGEFIHAMKGAQTSEQDQSECIQGPAGAYYKDLDFSQVMNCQRTPTIIDLDEGKANDTDVGQVPFCCRNGTILPAFMDPSKAKSVFQLQVYKVSPHLGREKLVPPTNFGIGNKYLCGQPRQVVPSEFPTPGNALHYKSAVASWEVTCNLTTRSSSTSAGLALSRSSPTCCVSFSAFYNESVIPCKTCACGCPAEPKPACNSAAEALLLPAEALLVPFSNRTSIARTWNTFKYNNKLPEPAPCGDNCGISINWHVLSDHQKGWLARMTILNWQEVPALDWFATVELDKATTGFHKSYSFNASLLPTDKNSLFLQGKQDFETLLQQQDQVPGKAQSVLAFSKGDLDVKISLGDGFPSRVLFNGEECALPTSIPHSSASSTLAISNIFFILFTAVWLLLS